MIHLKRDRLAIEFPEVHPDASLGIEFQRTFLIPDDDKEYPLPENESVVVRRVVRLRKGLEPGQVREGSF